MSGYLAGNRRLDIAAQVITSMHVMVGFQRANHNRMIRPHAMSPIVVLSCIPLHARLVNQDFRKQFEFVSTAETETRQQHVSAFKVMLEISVSM